MTKHFDELKAFVLQMGGAGCLSNEEYVCDFLLRSFPESFKALVQTFRVSVRKFTYSDVMNRVLEKGIRQKKHGHIEAGNVMLSGRWRQK